MVSILFKWFAILSLFTFSSSFAVHPLYISVTEIEHNSKGGTLEISCKIYTDDFEKTLRNTYKTQVDLLNPKETAAMNKLVSEYVTAHLKIALNGKQQVLQFKGYENIEEAIYSYYEIANVPSVKNIAVVNNILYEYKKEQMGFLHVIVNGERKSTRLDNPAEKANFEF